MESPHINSIYAGLLYSVGPAVGGYIISSIDRPEFSWKNLIAPALKRGAICTTAYLISNNFTYGYIASGTIVAYDVIKTIHRIMHTDIDPLRNRVQVIVPPAA